MSPKLPYFAFAAAPTILFGWLAWQELVPSGTYLVRWEPGDRSSFVDPVRPDQRVEKAADGTQVVIGDPVYTFLHPHRHFDAIDVEVRFHADDSVPIVEAGGLIKAGPDEAYALQPLENKLIDRSSWNRLDQDGLVLLQRTPTYGSVGEFLANLPAGNRIASYRFEGSLPDGTTRLLPDVDLDARGIDFVIARYATPRRDGEWSVATLRLDPSELLAQRGAWKVVFSVPGAQPGAQGFVLRRLDVAFRRLNLADTLRQRFGL